MEIKTSPLPDRLGLPQGGTEASLELLFHISRELASALDLGTVLERVVRLSLESIGGISCSFILLDDSGQPVNSVIITEGRVVTNPTAQLKEMFDRGLGGWTARTRTPALVSDTSEDRRWAERVENTHPKEGGKSAISVPLMAREQLVGVMTLVHPVPGYFTPQHMALIQSIADVAGIAILNARLYNESHRHAMVMTALVESSRSITGVLQDQDAIFDRILEQVQQALHVRGVVLFLSQGGHLQVMAASGLTDNSQSAQIFSMKQGITGLVAAEGKDLLVQYPSQHPAYDPAIDQLIEGGEYPLAFAPIRSQGQVIGVLQASFPMGSYFDPDAMLVLTGIGSLAGTVIQHAQLFNRLQAAHRSYRELFDDSIDPIIITDHQGLVIEANRQALHAVAIEFSDLQKLNIRDIHVIEQEALGDKPFSTLPMGTTLEYESRLIVGEQIPVMGYVRKIILDGRPCLQWTFRDISERKRLDMLRDDLIAMVYHDLRSPLTNVLYGLDFLRGILPAHDPSHSLIIDMATRAVDRIQRLTSSLLDINRLESKQAVLNRQFVEPRQLTDFALKAVSYHLESREQTLKQQIEEHLPVLSVDQDMIQRVLINLLENASKYSPHGTQISIKASKNDHHVEFIVADNGPGIPKDKLDIVFDKYQRLDTYGAGLGLGLAFCRLAVEGHGGTISVESEVSQGTRFIFNLPQA